MNNFIQKIKPYLSSVIMVSLAIILLVGVGLTCYFNWQEQSKILQGAKTRLEALTAKKASLDKLTSSSGSSLQLETLVNGVLVNESSVPVVMDQIQQIAGETGVTVVALQFSGSSVASTAAGTGNSIKLQASVSGPYQSVQSFLRSIESSGRLLLVSSLKFSSDIAQISSAGPVAQNGSYVTATLDINNPYFSGTVDPNADITALLAPEFTNLAKVIQNYKIYSPQISNGAVGKDNPFQK